MSSWMMRSTAAAALVMRSRMPSASVKPRIFWLRARSSNCAAISSSWRFSGASFRRVGASTAASMMPKRADRAYRGWSSKAWIRSWLGRAREVARPHAHLDQRAAELAADVGEVGRALGGPERAARPRARRPCRRCRWPGSRSPGSPPAAMMRVRTEMRAMMRWNDSVMAAAASTHGPGPAGIGTSLREKEPKMVKNVENLQAFASILDANSRCGRNLCAAH